MLEFIKNNKWKITVSSLLILLPTVVGLILFDKLPEEIPVHWGIDGTADGFEGKAFVVFAMPLILLAMHLLAIFVTSLDKKNRGQSKKVFSIVFFIVPFVSLLVFGIIYASAFGVLLDVGAVCIAFTGILFAVIGNYLPKCRQNSTIGVKVKWTLENEENWNATHRIMGRIWLIGGIVMIPTAFLPSIPRVIAFIAILCVLTIVPIVYSYAFYRKQMGKGK